MFQLYNNQKYKNLIVVVQSYMVPALFVYKLYLSIGTSLGILTIDSVLGLIIPIFIHILF